MKLLVSSYNRSEVFEDSQLFALIEATRERLYELIIFQKIHYVDALLNAMYTSTLAYEKISMR